MTFALTWLTVALGLSAPNVETASNTPMPLMFLPFLSSGFVPTDSMPAGLRWFAEYQPFTPMIDTLRAWMVWCRCRIRRLAGHRLVRPDRASSATCGRVRLYTKVRATLRADRMLTIGQLAAYAGVTVRAVRHYHQVGLLPEPERDALGLSDATAPLAVVELTKIRTLADAGVPLSQVGELLEADEATFADAVKEIDRSAAWRDQAAAGQPQADRASLRPATAWSYRRRSSPISTGCGSSGCRSGWSRANVTAGS